MIPILLSGTTVKGFLADALTCVVTEERNGIYELSLTYPVTGALFSELAVDRFINGNEWNHASVLWILHNYSYTGNLMLQSTYTENHITKKYRMNNGEYPMYHVEKSHEAIIPQEMFDEVQSESERRAAKYKRVENQNLTAYTGRVFCGKCGARCRRKMRNGKPVWHCNTSSTQGKNACAAKAVPESVLDSIEGKHKVQKFILCDENEIKIILENGEGFTEKWEYRSRSESWTAEMRQRAREQTTARNQKK